MEFTLFYQGDLRSNGGPKHKQEIRRALHPQLQRLWTLDPLAGCRQYVSYPPDVQICLLEPVGPFIFAPLISDRLALAAKVTITLLRPERPGNLVQQAGDIDNRLKTLFDALSVPAHANQLPQGDVPAAGEIPLYCLLQDDRLITQVSVASERLLTVDAATNPNHVVLVVHVKTVVTRHMFASIPFS